MANQYGIDLGKVYNDIETIKGNRLINSGRERELDQYEVKRNKDAKVRKLSIKFMANDSGSDSALKQLQLDAPEVATSLAERRDARVKKAQIKKNKGMMARSHTAANEDRGLAGKDGLTTEAHTKNYNDALTSLYNLDAPAAKLYEERFNDLDDADKERLKAANNKVGSYAVAVLRAPEEEQKAAYSLMRLEMGQEVGDSKVMPLEVSLPWLEYTAANAYSQLEVIKFSKKGNFVKTQTGFTAGVGDAPGQDEFTITQDGVITGTYKKPSTKGGTTVNNNIDNRNGKELTKEAEAMASDRVEAFKLIREQAKGASSKLEAVRQQRAVDPTTGMFVATRTDAARVLNAFSSGSGDVLFGVNVSKQDAAEALQRGVGLVTQQAQKGVQTASDTRIILQSAAHLGNTPEGYAYLLNMAEAVSLRQIEEFEFRSKWFYGLADTVDENGVLTSSPRNTHRGADEAWAKHVQDTPMASEVLKNAQGLPMFYWEYARNAQNAAKAQGRTVTDAKIAQAWRAQVGSP